MGRYAEEEKTDSNDTSLSSTSPAHKFTKLQKKSFNGIIIEWN
jgi:hypothetical protein